MVSWGLLGWMVEDMVNILIRAIRLGDIKGTNIYMSFAFIENIILAAFTEASVAPTGTTADIIRRGWCCPCASSHGGGWTTAGG
jgi:hypothetical protein